MINSNVIILRASRDMMLSNYSNLKTQSFSLPLSILAIKFLHSNILVIIMPMLKNIRYIFMIGLSIGLKDILILWASWFTFASLSCYYCIIHEYMGISIKYADGLTTNNIERSSICAFNYMFLISFFFCRFMLYVLLLICSFMIHTAAHEEWASNKYYREQFIANFCYITFYYLYWLFSGLFCFL